jgi:hypothetical protein
MLVVLAIVMPPVMWLLSWVRLVVQADRPADGVMGWGDGA